MSTTCSHKRKKERREGVGVSIGVDGLQLPPGNSYRAIPPQDGRRGGAERLEGMGRRLKKEVRERR